MKLKRLMILQERYVMSIGDLVTQAIFLCITPQVREAATALSKGEKKGKHFNVTEPHIKFTMGTVFGLQCIELEI